MGAADQFVQVPCASMSVRPITSIDLRRTAVSTTRGASPCAVRLEQFRRGEDATVVSSTRPPSPFGVTLQAANGPGSAKRATTWCSTTANTRDCARPATTAAPRWRTG